MNIIEKAYKWAYTPTKRTAKLARIIFHHAAAKTCSADDVHRWHLANGWAGIGYHFFIRKDGSVYRGRPLDTQGAHTYGHNSNSVGICYEGNFENEKPTAAQIAAGAELLRYLLGIFPDAAVGKHRDFNATACPGKNFPFAEIVERAKAAPEEDKEEPAGNVYIVEAGDTLSEIAAEHGTTVAKLVELNSIENPNLIHIGQEIKLPAALVVKDETTEKPAVNVYIVKKGDTLSKIAAEYRTTVQKLVMLNGIKNANLIHIGQEIKLTAGSKSLDELARECIVGKWGNGTDRRERLEAAGYDYEAVQRRVNELI